MPLVIKAEMSATRSWWRSASSCRTVGGVDAVRIVMMRGLPFRLFEFGAAPFGHEEHGCEGEQVDAQEQTERKGESVADRDECDDHRCEIADTAADVEEHILRRGPAAVGYSSAISAP